MREVTMGEGQGGGGSRDDGQHALLVDLGTCLAALPAGLVAETMRPLPIEVVLGGPPFLCGVSIVRGAPTPVVDLARLLGRAEVATVFGRFVTLVLGERRVALAVASVVGLRRLDLARFERLPPLLHDVATAQVEAIGALDAQLVLVLRASRLVPDEAWTALQAPVEAT